MNPTAAASAAERIDDAGGRYVVYLQEHVSVEPHARRVAYVA
jgi:hypothetical protein